MLLFSELPDKSASLPQTQDRPLSRVIAYLQVERAPWALVSYAQISSSGLSPTLQSVQTSHHPTLPMLFLPTAVPDKFTLSAALHLWHQP